MPESDAAKIAAALITAYAVISAAIIGGLCAIVASIAPILTSALLEMVGIDSCPSCLPGYRFGWREAIVLGPLFAFAIVVVIYLVREFVQMRGSRDAADRARGPLWLYVVTGGLGFLVVMALDVRTLVVGGIAGKVLSIFHSGWAY